MSNTFNFWLFMSHYIFFGGFSIAAIFDNNFIPTALIFGVNSILLKMDYEKIKLKNERFLS